MRVIAIANSKGGSGKTATVFNLGADLARRGHKVLLWDLDPQASLSNAFKVEFRQAQLYTEDILSTEKLDPSQAPVEVSANLHLIPATSALGGVEGVLATGNNIYRVRRCLDRLAALGFDFVLLDPPGATDIFMSAALVASHDILIPTRPTDTDFATMVEFKRSIDKVKDLNPELRIRGILFNQVITSSKNARIYRGFLDDPEWSDLVCQSSIRLATNIANSTAHGKDVISLEPKSKSATDYRKLTEEILLWN
jgi:chromosome partitioning protein